MYVCPIITISALVFGYSYLSYRQFLANPSDSTMPSIPVMLKEFVTFSTPDSAGRIWLLDDACATFGRHSLGLLIGVTLSAILGIAMGCFEFVEYSFKPILSFFSQVPATAMLTVFFILTGTGMEMFLAVIAFGVLPTLTQAVFQAAKFDVPEEMIYKAYTLGASNCEVIWNVVTRQIFPRIIEAVRLQVGPAMVYLIAAESFVGDVGFGYRLRTQSRFLNMALVYDYIFILGATGFLMNWLLTVFREWSCPWFDKDSK
jgi:NitT/TauT family transport system permease protein